MRKITFGGSGSGSGGGGGGGVSLPGGYDKSWMTPPVTTDTTVNGKNDVMALVVNVLDVGNRNYFSCVATGNYTVNVYATVGGTLISTQNVASGVQANWQIDYAACTHQIDTVTRQAYIEIVGNGGNLTSIVFNTNHPNETNANTSQNIVAAFAVLPAVTSMANCFFACYALQSVTLPSLPAVTSMTSCFSLCSALQSVTLPSLPAVTSMASCFYSCYSLQSVTLPSLPVVTSMTGCFYSCYSLQSVTLPSLPVVTSMTNCFYACYSLQSVTLPSLPAVTSMASCFYTCYALQSVTLPSLPAVTSMASCFSLCSALQSVTLPSLPAVTSMASCFYACSALQSVTLPSLPAVTSMTSCFGAAVTEGQSLRSLRKIILSDLRYGFALNYGALQSQEINALFASLGTASGAQTIDIRNQPGSAACDVSIAVLKGYTVVTS